MSTTDDTHDEIRQLQRELSRRLTAVPVRDWSPRLLRALISVLDLELDAEPQTSPPDWPRQLKLVHNTPT